MPNQKNVKQNETKTDCNQKSKNKQRLNVAIEKQNLKHKRNNIKFTSNYSNVATNQEGNRII